MTEIYRRPIVGSKGKPTVVKAKDLRGVMEGANTDTLKRVSREAESVYDRHV